MAKDKAEENSNVVMSPTVLQVLEQFVAAMRADPAISDDGIDRLYSFLSKGFIPKTPEQVIAMLFESTPEDQK